MDICGELICHALVDVVGIGDGVRIVVPKSREKYAGLIDTARVGKVAFLGSNSFIASLIETIGRMTGKGDKIRWFSDVDEAKEWLKE